MPNKQELIDKRLNLVAEYRKVCDVKPEDWTADVEARSNNIDEQIKAVEAEIDACAKSEEARAARVARLAELENKDRERRGDKRVGVDAGERREADPEQQSLSAERRQAMVLQAWLRSSKRLPLTAEHRSACQSVGIDPFNPELDLAANFSYGERSWSSNGQQGQREFRAGLDVATSGAGLETIPEGFMAELERRTLAFAQVRNVARVVKTRDGGPMPWPTVNDTSNTGELLGEATTFGTSVDPTFAAVTFNAYKYSSKPVFCSQEILEDSAFNLASELASMLGERLGRIEATHQTTGTGSSQPNGIVTAAGTGKTAASTTAFTADEVIDLVHSLDPSYRSLPSVGFMMNDAVVKYIRKLKDSNGQYLLQPGLTMGVPDTLLGYKIAINQSMSSTFTTGQKLILFGAFEKYIIRDVANVRMYRLDERYRDVDQTAFVAFKRWDADTIQASGLKLLVLA